MKQLLLLAGFIVYLFMFPALALRSDSSQPIHINSSTQSVDLQKNTMTFEGNVYIKQGTIEIQADRVVVNRSSETNNVESVNAFGNPVRFTQRQENGKPVNGRGQELHYSIKNERVLLSGNAYMEQLNSNIRAAQIEYLVKEQRIKAKGGYNHASPQTETVLTPNELQNK